MYMVMIRAVRQAKLAVMTMIEAEIRETENNDLGNKRG